jgi:hypothetical protein
MQRIILVLALVFGGSILIAQIPTPMDDHPGNIFVSGEDVSVPLPSDSGDHWKAVDYDGRVVARGDVRNGHADLGKLPVGFYSVQAGGVNATVGVLAPLKAATPEDSPIGIGVFASWNYTTPEKWHAVASLSALAGVKWVRDAYSWGPMQPQRGELVKHIKFDDSKQILHDAGLRILAGSPSAPSWTNATKGRFPPDLRDAYNFYRAIAERWRDRVDAFEAWNEADFHNAGSEIASYQKAAYLGFKAGNPDVTVSMIPWGVPSRTMLLDFMNNDLWPYFDVYSFHDYEAINRYPDTHKWERALSKGKPIWLSEVNLQMQWAGDPTLNDPTPDNMRVQAERVPKVFAASLHQHVKKVFFFCLENDVEGQNQFGILRKDLTPRPAYVAMAAVGRFLAGAEPIGQLHGVSRSNSGSEYAFAFKAVPDGKESDVVVAWVDGGQSELYVPVEPEGIYDHLGRQLPALRGPGVVRISSAPVYIVLPAGSVREWTSRDLPSGGDVSRLRLHTPAMDPPPALEGEQQFGPPSPVVLQVLLTEDQLIKGPHPDLSPQPWNSSIAHIGGRSRQQLQVFAYNFSAKPIHVRVQAGVPSDWTVSLPQKEFDLPAMGRVPIPFEITPGSGDQGNPGTVSVHALTPGLRTSVLSFLAVP